MRYAYLIYTMVGLFVIASTVQMFFYISPDHYALNILVMFFGWMALLSGLKLLKIEVSRK